VPLAKGQKRVSRLALPVRTVKHRLRCLPVRFSYRFFNPFLRRISMNKIVALRVAAGSLALAAASSFAAIDVTAATTGVTDAQTAVLAVMGVMITMAAAIYGVKKVLALLGR
jgi:hypothetical protein